MNFQTNEYGDAIGPRQPLVTDDLLGNELVSQSETITYNGKAAAGALTVNALTLSPVMNVQGDKVGSYWGKPENFIKSFNPANCTVTETNGSAAIAIIDPNTNLELAFETGTAPWRFIIKLTDEDDNVLYGWIAGIAASSSTYTFTVYNTRTGTTQNWVGTIASFTHTAVAKVEIYRYSSSLAFGTGTTLTEEVELPNEYSLNEEQTMDWAIDN